MGPQLVVAILCIGAFVYTVMYPMEKPLIKLKDGPAVKVEKLKPEVERSQALDKVDLEAELDTLEPLTLQKEGKTKEALNVAREWGSAPRKWNQVKQVLAAGTVLLSSDSPKDRWIAGLLYKRALRLAPLSQKLKLYLADKLFESGNLKASEEQLEAALPNCPPEDSAPRMTLARIYMILNQPSKAVELFQAILKIEPDNPYALEMLGIAKGQGGDVSAGLEDFKKGAKLNLETETVFDPDLKPLVARRDGSLDSVINDLRETLEVRPKDVRIIDDLVLLTLKLDRDSDAKKDLDAALSKYPDDAGLHTRMAEYALRTDKDSLVASEFEKVTKNQAGMRSKPEDSYSPTPAEQAEMDKISSQADEMMESAE